MVIGVRGRRSVLGAVGLLFLASWPLGCSDDAPTAPEDPLLGEWSLVAVNGEPLPLVRPWNPVGELHEGQADLRADGTMVWSQRICQAGGEACEWTHLGFEWEQDGEFVHILFQGGDPDVGSPEWAVFRLVDGELRGPRIDGIHLLFHRP